MYYLHVGCLLLISPMNKVSMNLMMSSLTEVRSQAPGDEVVGPSPLHLPVGADGRHGEGGDGSDHS